MSGPTEGGTLARTAKLRAHWVLLAALLLALAAGLAVQAPARVLAPDLYRALPSGADDAVPDRILAGGPGVAAGPSGIQAFAPAERTIALTFDDGPDPEWTPAVLAVLAKHRVPGTFFVLGERAIRHPGVLRQVVEAGSEVGVHSFSHANLAVVPAWQAQLELRMTQLALEGAAGTTTALFRPPFSSTNKALDNGTWNLVQQAAGQGYVSVLINADGRDWARPGVPAIEAALTPSGSAGQVWLLHDGGGDRSETVAAIDRLIPLLQARGYRFTTAGTALGLTGANAPAPLPNRLLGAVVVWGLWASTVLVAGVGWAMLGGGVIALIRAIFLVITARRHRSRPRRAAAPVTEPVSVIVPAYNEAAGIEAAVASLAASTHPVEVVVVDDGSTDGTHELVRALRLPNVHLIRQENAGKPAALNTGLRAAQHELVVMVDGDTVFEPATVATLVQPFADPEVGAVSGNAKVANRRGLLGRWQHIEYVIGFNMDRRWYDLAECMPTVPGAVGAFRRRALEQVGGLSDDTLAEDTDLTMALGRAGWRIVYAEDARAWTEAPATLRALWRQRYRWCYGTLQSMWKHRHGVSGRGRAGRYARRSLSYMLVFQILLPLLAPAVDVFAVYGLLFADPVRTVGIWLGFQALDLFVAQYAFRLDRERLRVLWALPATQFCYRQLMYAVVIQSLATAVAGTRLRWHRMDRYGTFATRRPA